MSTTFKDEYVIKLLSRLDNYTDCKELLDESGYSNLGWLNSGIELPEQATFEKVYANRSGSSCLYADHVWRMYYSVDMGD